MREEHNISSRVVYFELEKPNMILKILSRESDYKEDVGILSRESGHSADMIQFETENSNINIKNTKESPAIMSQYTDLKQREQRNQT